MRVLGLAGGDRESLVPALAETIGERLRLIDGRHAGQAHLLDQPILQGLVGALHPALGLRGRGVNEFDAQPLDDAAELGEAVAALRLLGVDAENPVPIRVEGQRQAVREHVRLQALADRPWWSPPGRIADAVNRPVASSMNTISAQRGPRPSSQSCGLPSI